MSSSRPARRGRRCFVGADPSALSFSAARSCGRCCFRAHAARTRPRAMPTRRPERMAARRRALPAARPARRLAEVRAERRERAAAAAVQVAPGQGRGVGARRAAEAERSTQGAPRDHRATLRPTHQVVIATERRTEGTSATTQARAWIAARIRAPTARATTMTRLSTRARRLRTPAHVSRFPRPACMQPSASSATCFVPRSRIQPASTKLWRCGAVNRRPRFRPVSSSAIAARTTAAGRGA